jgi:hypothetical protein
VAFSVAASQDDGVAGSERVGPMHQRETAVEHFIGIDVSLEQSSLCVVDTTGKIVREAKVASGPEVLAGFCRGLSLAIVRIGLEAGPLSPSGGSYRPPLSGRIERFALDGSMPG